MLSKEEHKRYNRQVILEEIGEKGQLKLKHAKVLVVGAGGLGCPVIQYLAAAGIGTIGIMDDDLVDLSNLQRQILFTKDDIGYNKAQIAAKKGRKLNSEIEFIALEERLTLENITEVFEPFDLIIDGTDSYETKYLINDGCLWTGKPMIYGSIYKFEGQVSVFNYLGGPSYRCLFPIENKLGFGCSDSGVIGILAGLIGLYQANEAIKIITGSGVVLSGQLLTIDTKSNMHYLMAFEKNPEEVDAVLSSNPIAQSKLVY